ncbi:HNH endonuclease [Rhodococcus sp. KBS0724]|uniref:HNH endonuclease n=1 Tax=Rhodococcus sp. KBS0724 TaxID=1179674 RepID=UPI00110F29E6|nr:HNH endonuclease signature motif containing protein [Rhodococcus sp. KBS0724]TSD40504.1 HNH endonuclease [Rhodococcus sp. KBS0724]
MGEARAWVLTSAVEGERSWHGNDGYADVLGVRYLYDNDVAYYKQASVGDLVIVRESKTVFGVSRIDTIEHAPGEKLRRRCPVCGNASAELRKRTNGYACGNRRCSARAIEPVERYEPVKKYVASYGIGWRALDGAISYADLEPHLSGASQHSIRPCDIKELEKLLGDLGVSVPPAPAGELDVKIPGGRRDSRTKARNGQNEFRKALLQKYGLHCAVTGPCPAEALQAAHLRPFAEHETHSVGEGMLLRSDIHQLFDAGLIAINPVTMTVAVAPTLTQYTDYMKLEGAKVGLNSIDVELLQQHHAEVSALW